ncbi:nitrogenase component 1 [Tissierella praeacuta]|uniref:nitrogenase component 1 n=1 Tax=Tissierella praeacuta TaxID=43131 RepID=UPI0033412F63
MKKLKHLKRLSAIKTNAGVKFLTPAAFPGNHCPLHTTLGLSSNIKGMSTLVVGTSECGTYSRNLISQSKNKDGELHWMYILDSNEVVFGCRKGVIQAIKDMDKAGAKSIMIILTCVPEVIGEDIEGIVHEIQLDIKAKLTFVLVGHFKCNSYPSGYWKTLLAFGNLMEKSQASSNIVNVLGRSPEEEHIPMPELLTALEKRGFQLRMLAPKSDIKDFIESPNAILNLVISPFMNPMAEMMQNKYQIPFISLHEFYDVCEINSLYESVAEKLCISWDNEFDEVRQEAIELQNQVKNIFSGVNYISTHVGALDPLPLVLYLDQFNMNPILLHLDEFYPDDRKWAKVINEKGHNPMICHMVNDDADIHVLNDICIGFSFGELLKGKSQVPCIPYLYNLYGQIGYERTKLLLSGMLNAFSNKTFGIKEV